MRVVTALLLLAIGITLAVWTLEARSARCCWLGHAPLDPDWQSRCKRCGLDAWQQVDDDELRSVRWFLVVVAGVLIALSL